MGGLIEFANPDVANRQHDPVKMPRHAVFLLAAISLAVATPTSVFVADNVASRPHAFAPVLAVTWVLVCGGLALVLGALRHLGAIEKAVVVFCAAGGLALVSWIGVATPGANRVDVHYSDGSADLNLPPFAQRIWERRENTWSMHPAYDNARVPNVLHAMFDTNPHAIELWIAKPREAIYYPNGDLTPSDGIGLEVSITGPAGEQAPVKTIYVPERAFIDSRWIVKRITGPVNIHELTIRITPGPPGSTPAYDATLIALRNTTLHARLHELGEALLGGIGGLVIGFALLAASPRRSYGSAHARSRFPWRTFGAMAVVAGVILGYVLWFLAHTHLIYFWDSRNYWQKTEQLYELMSAQSWAQLFSALGANYSADYSDLPAFPLALLSLARGYPGHAQYLLLVTALYAVPSFLVCAWLGKLLVGATRTERAAHGWPLAALVLFAASPVYFGTVLHMLPDIAGVIFCALAAVVASTLLGTLREPLPDLRSARFSREVVIPALALGTLIASMFLFRRWYVFFSAGLIGMCGLSIAWQLVRGPRVGVLLRTVLIVWLMAMAGLALLGWVAFDWLADPATHDYANLYASYAKPLAQSFADLLSSFGWLYLILIAGLLVALPRVFTNHRLAFVLGTTSVIASVLFVKVQSPGPQHYYLLMPLFGAVLCGGAIALARARGLWVAALVTIACVALNATATRTVLPRALARAVPNYSAWAPASQYGLVGLEQAAEWAQSPAIRDKRLCLVASSGMLNQSIFTNVWQIDKRIHKGALEQQLAWLGDVDSRDGAPWRSFRDCEIALVGMPFQTHIAPDQQYTQQIIRDDLLSGTGVGANFEATPQRFELDQKNWIAVYRRKQPLTDAQYDDLVQRFKTRTGIQH
ncbi:hypothetical protein [Paraburkholderia lycopersici]|uniref:Uncharacterized protein n=1 Tax=Paraburkholderia lycopersici TaxID=416944 RepID=A0A1G6NFR1_9BURK|nr:hypothetical protein [Paraburkholderia lycopersici]SDC66638.1 hypothetical protein SAMN05421548_10937 [Paraburkholderia lycopersici]